MRQWKEKEEGGARKILRLMTQIALIAVTALFCVNYFGFQVRVEGRSMEPVIEQDSTVLVNLVSTRFFAPSRFDIIAFEKSDAGTEDKNGKSQEEASQIYVKYVIGLPGETVQIKEGKVWINGKILDTEEYLDDIWVEGLAKNPIMLGEDEYFVLGANLGSSEDSRFATIKNVKREQILGKVWFSYHSFTDMGFL